ncbi:unnamed protein product [Ranitomeya imitator]|uniref:Uncharacterized protein n=1 Tax=Ranitomeya imitator TaxID=111125 RepID=A0ABN9M1L2_9NEOB|nr:unnamed protein product [Ranitomeya imitator]
MSLHHVDVKGLSPTPSVVKRDHVRDRVELLVDDVRALPGCLKLIRWYGDQHPHLLTHVVGPLPGVLVVPVLLISLSLRHVVMHQLRQGLHLVTEAHDILHYGHFRRVRGPLFPGFSYQPKGSPDSPAVQELEGGEPRRGLRNFSKHIAHGLIPAATVAPRSAVPRTPPPRSPNPSPERPRSALAAAILMTSLTGRTVAIPQPRQRSYSENDSARMEDQIEPYATARDLGVQQNWNTYADGGDMRSPVMSFDFEDDDTEEQMSDIEREQIEQRDERRGEGESPEPLYATPLKDRQKKTQPVIRQEEESGRSSPEVSNYPVETEFHTTEDHRVESPIPHPDSEESKEQLEHRVGLAACEIELLFSI